MTQFIKPRERFRGYSDGWGRHHSIRKLNDGRYITDIEDSGLPEHTNSGHCTITAWATARDAIRAIKRFDPTAKREKPYWDEIPVHVR